MNLPLHRRGLPMLLKSPGPALPSLHHFHWLACCPVPVISGKCNDVGGEAQAASPAFSAACRLVRYRNTFIAVSTSRGPGLGSAFLEEIWEKRETAKRTGSSGSLCSHLLPSQACSTLQADLSCPFSHPSASPLCSPCQKCLSAMQGITATGLPASTSYGMFAVAVAWAACKWGGLPSQRIGLPSHIVGNSETF